VPNPPTYDDLKRSRYSGRFKLPKRSKLVFQGVTSFIIPDLTLPDFNLFLGQELNFVLTDNVIGTESLDTLNGGEYSNDVTYDTELYAGADLSVSPGGCPYDSLWFVNNNFISRSVNLNSSIQSPGIQSFQREFYPFNATTKVTSSYSFSAYDYNDLNISLSSNTNNVEGVWTGVNFTKNITYTNILCTGKFLQDNVNFKVDYGDDNTSNVFNSINNILNHIYTFNSPFTGIKTATLSTIRADGIYDIDTTSIPIQFKISSSVPLNLRSESIQTTWQTISSVPNPEGQQDKFRFLNSPTTLSAEWNPDWWGYGSRDLYNFSGVSYKGSGNPDENNITLITPKHGVCNSHYGGIGPGDVIYYYDYTTGAAVSAIVTGREVTGVDDITVVKFDRDLTALGDIKVYKLPLYTTPLPADFLCTIYQGGNGPYGTGSSDRHAGLGTHSAITDVIGTPLFDTQIGKTDLWSVSSVFENTYFSLSSLAVGDSSSPTFIIAEDDILLTSTFRTGNGAGPNYGLSAIQAVLSAGIQTLGNTEGYVLSTVEIS
jgi:hypothetical protein